MWCPRAPPAQWVASRQWVGDSSCGADCALSPPHGGAGRPFPFFCAPREMRLRKISVTKSRNRFHRAFYEILPHAAKFLFLHAGKTFSVSYFARQSGCSCRTRRVIRARGGAMQNPGLTSRRTAVALAKAGSLSIDPGCSDSVGSPGYSWSGFLARLAKWGSSCRSRQSF